MSDPNEKLTAANAIAPNKYSFGSPDDIESGCKCEDVDHRRNFKCTGGEACSKAGGVCRLALVSPGDPHLRLFDPSKTKGADDKEGFVSEPAPGWRLICACLKFTDQEPTKEEKKKFPAWPKWQAPDGFAIPADPEPCAAPKRDGARRWHCAKGCFLVGVEKDSLKLHVLSTGGDHGAKQEDVEKYPVVFCIHLDKKP